MSWEFSRYHSGRFHGLEVDVTNLSLMVSEVKKKEFREYVLKKKRSGSYDPNSSLNLAI